MLEVIVEIEPVLDFRRCHFGRDIWVSLKQFHQRFCAVGFPHLHRIALNDVVAVLTANTRLSQRQKHPLRMDKSAHAVEILLHTLWVDKQLVDDTGQAAQREIKGDGRIRSDIAFDAGMADISFMPQRDIFERWRNITANHARKTRQVFGEHRVALMRHGRAALLTGREIFFRLQHLSALQMAHLCRKAFNGLCDDTKRRKIHRMTVARDDLRRDGLHRKAKLGCDMCLHLRIDIGEGADSA